MKPHEPNSRSGSAELHSAVSQIFNLRRVTSSEALEFRHYLPNAIRRYSRVQLCATP
jgi:hypothetical protein